TSWFAFISTAKQACAGLEPASFAGAPDRVGRLNSERRKCPMRDTADPGVMSDRSGHGGQDVSRDPAPAPHASLFHPADHSMRRPLALEIRGLSKRYEHPAVDGLDLCGPAGEFYTLLGPNGAGKTTTLRMVTGLLKPDQGSIAVHGIDALADPIGA